MKISKIKKADMQLRLWDEPLGGYGHVRTSVGDFVEYLFSKLLGGDRHKTDSSCDYCPDVSAGGIYYECKGAGRNRDTFIYQGRLEKDKRFSEDHQLVYGIWHHRLDSKKVKTVLELQTMVLRTTVCIYFIPFEILYELTRSLKLVKLNSKKGWGKDNELYTHGYRFPLHKLDQVPHMKLDWELQSWRI